MWAPPVLPPRRPAPSAASARGSERSGDAAAPPRRSEVRGAAVWRGRGGGRAGAAACASVCCHGRLPRAAPRPALRCGGGRGGCGLASLRAGSASFCRSSVSRLAPRMRGAGRAGKGGGLLGVRVYFWELTLLPGRDETVRGAGGEGKRRRCSSVLLELLGG